jgi:hypothetical protein
MEVKVENGNVILLFRNTEERDILEIGEEYKTGDYIPGYYEADSHALGILCERVTIYPK